MKFRTLMLANAAVLLTCAGTLLASPAFAGEGWYVGLGAGWDRPDASFHYSNGAVAGKTPYDDAWIGVGALGYKYGNWRLEAEGSGSHDKFEGGYTGGTVWTGASANLLYDIPVTDRWAAYIGGGVGMGDINREAYGHVSGAGQFEQWGFQWQGIAGLTYEASPNFDLFVEYRYRGLETQNATLLYGGSGPVSTSHETANVALVGVRWYPWSAPETVAYQPPPPLPAPPPPPPPAPPAPVKTFIVFFDFNKSDLTAEAQNVVSEAVKVASQKNAVRIMITGHTDTVGTDTYNQALSERRAETVKDEMMREGMKSDDISTIGKSFHDPLVATGPNVREPQNRRAVIDLGG